MKENVEPHGENILVYKQSTSGEKGKQKVEECDQVIAEGKWKSPANEEYSDGISIVPKPSETAVEEAQKMDCGDVVRVFAYTGGIKEEIGKAIVMGLASSKFAEKIIPNAWRSIKFTSCTEIGASKICPFPRSWVEQLKSKTVKEMNGRMILWPDMLLQPLGGV